MPARLVSSQERGLSMIEALIMLAVTGLAASVLFGLVGRGAADTARVAARSIDIAERGAVERAFRDVAASAGRADAPGGRRLEGGVDFLALHPTPGLGPCPPAPPGEATIVRIAPAGDGGRLECVTPTETRRLADWERGAAAFSFSGDGGATWMASWPPEAERRTPRRPLASAPLVRLRIVDETGGALVAAIALAGDDAPAATRPR